MRFVIGYVTAVRGTSIRALIHPNLYQTTYIHDGCLYRGVAINELIVIKKGFHDIIGKIEGEEIIEKRLLLNPNQIKKNLIGLLTSKSLDMF